MREYPGHDDALAADELPAWTFFRQWLKNPLATASLAPSGQQLAHAMVAQLPADARRVVELGGGTGVFTQALLAHGIPPEGLLVLELNDELHRLLQRRFPSVEVVHGDARNLVDILATTGFAAPGEIDAVVSGLGFLAMPRVLQREILRAVFAVLGPGRPLIQFTYGPRSPLPRSLLAELGIAVHRGGLALKNMPPALVYVYAHD